MDTLFFRVIKSSWSGIGLPKFKLHLQHYLLFLPHKEIILYRIVTMIKEVKACKRENPHKGNQSNARYMVRLSTTSNCIIINIILSLLSRHWYIHSKWIHYKETFINYALSYNWYFILDLCKLNKSYISNASPNVLIYLYVEEGLCQILFYSLLFEQICIMV